MTNLFTDVPAHLPEELFTTLLEDPNVRIERIISHGHASPDGFWLRVIAKDSNVQTLLRLWHSDDLRADRNDKWFDSLLQEHN